MHAWESISNNKIISNGVPDIQYLQFNLYTLQFVSKHASLMRNHK